MAFTEINVKHFKGQEPGIAAEWWTDKDLENWRNQIEEWKKDGSYRQELESTLFIMPNPMFSNENDGLILDVNRIIKHEFKPL